MKDLASKMLGQKLVTKQSGPEGMTCQSVMVAERKFSRREFYFAISLAKEFNGPVLIASRFGGVDIEEVEAKNPEAVIYEPIDQCNGLTREMAEWVVRRVGIVDQTAPTVKMLCNLYKLFIAKDALLVEVNPYVEDVCLNYYALDVKLNFDDSAKFRQAEVFAKRDLSQEDAKEVAARNLDLNYVALDGTIGCLVNGSGLAMATVDILRLYGGRSANFLNVGEMASAEAVKNAVGIVLMDPKVRTLFINIYGGIMRCDIIIEGLSKAIREFDIKVPIVVRLQGNMQALGKKMILEKKINVISRDDFTDAAETAVRCSKILDLAEDGDMEAVLKMKFKCDCVPIPAQPKTLQKVELKPPCPPHATKVDITKKKK